jgi:hypothetical protein
VTTDTVLRQTIIEHLIETYGNVETERFISLIIREPFDYTKWRRERFDDQSVEDIFAEMREIETI